MTNVLHHLPDAAAFLAEASRCVKPGGAIVMIEPWVTPWSRRIYGNLHHEPFDPHAESWSMAPGRPLSMANGALPWIIFRRDRRRFDAQFPDLEVIALRPLMPLAYLLSGGISMRGLLPGWMFPCVSWLDRWIVKLMPGTAMFAQIIVRRGTS
jgi:SAM-dependent methyltransferase